MVIAAPGDWWDADWPYRMKITAPAGEGDVAQVTVALAGRTTPDGRDLRMVTETGDLHHFEMLHHDPRLQTLLQFKVSPDRDTTVWLYYGNPTARKINTMNPHLGTQQRQWAAWKRRELERASAIRRRKALEGKVEAYREHLVRAERADPPDAQVIGRLRQRIAQSQRQAEAIGVPPAQPEPSVVAEWNPQRGVLLRIYRTNTTSQSPDIEAFYKLIGRSALEGAAFRDGVSDGFNPFGPSDEYASSYEGYLRIDKPGEYRFCTASDDGSWVWVNDRMVVAWPGGHGASEGARGEKNGRIALKPGVAKVRYYHQEGSGGQVAFMGWKPPWAKRFSAIPKSQWLSVRTAKAHRPDARDLPVMAVANLRVFNTYWIYDSDNQQATMIEFDSDSWARDAKIVSAVWDFGDGLSANGEKVRHVYFRNGRPNVTLTVRDDRGRTDRVVCSPDIFQVDVKASYFQYGNRNQYARTAAGYDVKRMARDDLQRYADFWHRLEEWPEHVRAAEAFIDRFGDHEAAPRLASSAADACLQPQAYKPRQAERLLSLAAERANDHRQRVELALRRAAVLAWELQRADEAEAIYRRVDQALKDPKQEPELAYRIAVGIGDALLLQAKYDAAEQQYRRAGEIAPDDMDDPERAAKTGSYPYMVDDLLARDEFEWAHKALDRWETEFPVQKLEGYTFFLRGKVYFVQHPGEQALGYLNLAERVAPEALHVPETVWLRANCLMAMGRHQEALDEFKRIMVDFTDSQYYRMAPEKIARCEKEVANR